MDQIRRVGLGIACVLALAAASGCNSPVGMAVQVVGKAVDSADAQKLGNELIGKNAAAADAKLGQPIDVWRETHGSREWRVYAAPMDVLGNQRNVVQMAGGKVVGVALVTQDKSGIDLARNMMLDQKVMGKTPAECQSALGMGPPIVTARSEKTGMTAQLYNAQMLQGVGSMQYCRLLFDAGGHCTECKLVDVNATAGAAAPS